MLYNENISEELLDEIMANYNIIVEKGDGIMNELNVDLKLEKKGTISIHLLPNGIRNVSHGLRIKVRSVDGKKSAGGYEFPVNPETGVVTVDKTLLDNEKIGVAISKTIAGFAKENLDLLNRFNGYRDSNNKIIDGDPNVEDEITKAADRYNALPKSEKLKIISKGEIKKI